MNMIELDGVGKSYGRKPVLSDVTVGLPVGLTLLTGPSGSGKSTLLRLIASAERPSSGRLSFEGQPLPAATKALRRSLGFAPQAVDLPDDLGARAFAMHIAALKGLEPAAADRQFAAIADAIGLHADIDNRIATFSGGMRRRLILAQALLGAPRLIVLDEPTAELDRETARRVSALVALRARTAAIVMTTHLAEEIGAEAVQILRIEDGRVAAA